MPRVDALSALRRLAQETHFFSPAPVTYRTARGALDVLGALNADAGGTLAQMPLYTHAAVAVQALSEPVLRIRSGQIMPPLGDPEVVLPADCREVPAPARWAAGLLALWRRLRPAGAGAAILLHSDIPQGAGQASSTALLVAAAYALTDPRAAPSPLEIAREVAAAEAESAGAAPPFHGQLIQSLTCMHPRMVPARVLRYSAQPYRFVGPVPLPPDVRMLALDTGVRYRAGSGAQDGVATLQEFRVTAAVAQRLIETVYRDLGQPHTPLHGYLANTSPLLYRQYFRSLLPRRLRGSDFLRTYGEAPGFDPAEDAARVFRVRTIVDHLIAEHEHAEQFLQAMEELAGVDAPPLDDAERQRTLQRAGRLLLASHHSYRLRLELSCREADWLVDRLMESGPEAGVYGARITGTGGGGTVAALLDRSPRATDLLLQVIKSYHQLTGLTLGVTEA